VSFAPQQGERWTLAALAGGAVLAAVTLPPPGEGLPLAPLLLLAIGLFTLGIPHGCFDQEVWRLLRKRRKRRVHLLAFLVGYLLLVLLYALLWIASPLLGLLSFYLLTWYHWGVGDRDWETFVRRQPIGGGQRWDRAVFVFVRGGLPMALPFLFHPERVEWFLQACLDLFPNAGTPALAPAVALVGGGARPSSSPARSCCPPAKGPAGNGGKRNSSGSPSSSSWYHRSSRSGCTTSSGTRDATSSACASASHPNGHGSGP